MYRRTKRHFVHYITQYKKKSRQKAAASTPFLAVNPILIAAEIINSLQGLVSRESTYNVPAVLTVTSITAGNGAYNIIPNSATIVGGLRTQSFPGYEKTPLVSLSHLAILFPCLIQIISELTV